MFIGSVLSQSLAVCVVARVALLSKDSPLSAYWEQDEVPHGSLSIRKAKVSDHWKDLEGGRKVNVPFSSTISRERRDKDLCYKQPMENTIISSWGGTGI